MEDLKQYYNKVFKAKLPKESAIDFDKLDSKQIKLLKNSMGFVGYNCAKSLNEALRKLIS